MLLNYSNSWELMFTSDQNFTGTRGRNFMGKLQHLINKEIKATLIYKD